MSRRLYLCMLIAISACSPLPPRPAQSLIGVDNHPVVIIREAGRQAGEDEAIRAYESFLAHAPADDPRRSIARRRIAVLHLAAAEAADLVPGREGLAQPYYLKAIAAYEALLRDSPRDEDELLYGLAHAYAGARRTQDMRRTLGRLIAGHPDSSYRKEAMFRLAEDAFARADLETAMSAYRSLIDAGGKGPFAQRARYMLAWTLLRSREYRASAQAFLALITAQASPGMETLASQRLLYEDSLRGLALALRQLDGAESLDHLLEGRRPDNMARLYEVLGEQQQASGHADEAIASWRHYVLGHVEDPAAIGLWIRIIRLETTLGQTEAAQKSKHRFATLYAPESPFWQEHSLRDIPAAAATLAQLFRELGSRAHARAEQTGADRDYGEAARWYRDYLELFSTEAGAADIRYLLAELYEASGQMEAASQAYERFAYGYPGDRRAAGAAFAALQLTLPEADIDDDYLQRLKRFVNTFPRYPETPVILANVAGRLYDEGRRDEALGLAQSILAWQPQASPAVRRTALLIKARQAVSDGRLAHAQNLYEHILSLPGDDEHQRSLGMELAQIIYRRGREAFDAGRWAEAATLLGRIREIAPASSVAVTADFDAATALMQAGRWSEAVAILERLSRATIDEAMQRRLRAKLAMALVEAGEIERAVKVLLAIANDRGNDADVRREALLRAAGLAQEDGNDDEATGLYRRYIAQFPHPYAEAQHTRRLLADLAREHGRQAEYRHWLRAMIDAASDRPRPTPIGAAAALELADQLAADFAAIRLDLPLGQSLQRKKESFETVLAAYRRAAALSEAEVTTAASYKLAESYASFARALMQSERPPGLDDDARDDYDVLLEEQAEPFEARAIELYEGNLARLGQNYYDHWIEASLERLAELFPARYARREQGEPYLEGTGP